ncbi:hypothetical protein [Aeoliella mucimassa]|uniref:PEP-CTERM protein-sorting domain-containing protein n=1 Tax=Aeoliella mucimassa TaxID=2527972 RepID=A0A518AVN5_9BACT|nr:hypothetical protein [Aeoliella mucimassa]QDU58795.1 hypothetical protein Pan181_50350 [Aeoliella mucimassa]
MVAKLRASCSVVFVLVAFSSSVWGQTDPSNFANVINVPPTTIGNLYTIASDTQLNLSEGGTIGDWLTAGDSGLEDNHIEINATGGVVGYNPRVFPGTTVNIDGAEIGSNFYVYGSTVHLEDGTIGPYVRVREGTLLDVKGGSIDYACNLGAGTTLQMSGGSIGTRLRANEATVDISAGMIDSDFDLEASELYLRGGSIGDDFNASKSSLNISGGAIGNNAVVFFLNEVAITGGTIGNNMRVFTSSTATISGGTFGDNFTILPHGPRIVSPDSDEASAAFEPPLAALKGDLDYDVLISGGTFGDAFKLYEGTLVLVGSEFYLDGIPIEGLGLEEPFELTERDVTLSGVLQDGSPFSFDLNSTSVDNNDYFSPDASLYIAQVPEPQALALFVSTALLAIVLRTRQLRC